MDEGVHLNPLRGSPHYTLVNRNDFRMCRMGMSRTEFILRRCGSSGINNPTDAISDAHCLWSQIQDEKGVIKDKIKSCVQTLESIDYGNNAVRVRPALESLKSLLGTHNE